jgi:hypothetical protein
MNMGNQVRGFGFGHDGTIDTIDSFLGAHHFGLSKTERSQVEKFIMVFPTDLAPMVGQQVTLTTGNTTPATTRIAKMVTAAKTTFESPIFGTATECELIVKGIVSVEGSGEVARGWFFNGTGFYDDAGGSIGEAALRSTVTPTRPLTYTCVPPGSGYSMGIDRDNDMHLDNLDYLRVDLLEPPSIDPSP